MQLNGDVLVYSATMWYVLWNHAAIWSEPCDQLWAFAQPDALCKIYVLFATPFIMGRFEILVPPAKSEMETENLSVSARQGWANLTNFANQF